MDFTRENPGIVVYLHPKRNRPAKLVAEYCKRPAFIINLILFLKINGKKKKNYSNFVVLMLNLLTDYT